MLWLGVVMVQVIAILLGSLVICVRLFRHWFTADYYIRFNPCECFEVLVYAYATFKLLDWLVMGSGP